MFERHPVTGVGLAGFPLAYPHYRTTHAAALSLTDSHTTVVTVAAEQGLIGLAAFAFLLVTFFAHHPAQAALRRRPAPLSLAGRAGRPACSPSSIHSLTYNAFFEDPYMWVFMALASAVATRIVTTDPLAALPAATPADGAWSPHAAAKAATRRRDAETAGSR